jgi:hypothetical protein
MPKIDVTALPFVARGGYRRRTTGWSPGVRASVSVMKPASLSSVST